jgi:hypothetical protein
MRSGLIFAVSSRFSNRYMLCRMVAISARKMHRGGVSTSQSINNSLRALHDSELQQGGEQQSGSPAVPESALQIVDEEETAVRVR